MGQKFTYYTRELLGMLGLARLYRMRADASAETAELREEAANAYELLGRVAMLEHKRAQALPASRPCNL